MRYGPLLDATRGVRWPARAAVRSAVPGVHHSRLRGTSAEVTEYKLYRQGDDPRRLDWKLLARTDRPFIRLATSTAVLPTVFVADASLSMAFPEGEASKWAQGRAVAVGLAAVAHRQGDPVGLVALGETASRLPARTRRGVIDEIAATLDAVRPGGDGAAGAAVAALRGTGRAVVVSDFLAAGDDATAALVAAAARHAAAGGELHAVHVVADEELEPPPAGVAYDPERPDLRRPLSPAARAEYQRAFGEWRSALARDLRAAGAGYTLVATGDDPAQAVRRVVAPVELAVGARR